MKKRRKTKVIKIGNVFIGSPYPIVVQSMTNTDTKDTNATIEQIHQLTQAGCEIVRVAVPDIKAAKSLGKIKDKIKIPIIADIHFNYKLALISIDQGIDALRLNPGNIKKEDKIKEIVKLATLNKIPIRIGVNSGSVTREILQKCKGDFVKAMIESAFQHIRILENMNFNDIKISVKASDVPTTIKVYKKLASLCDYPLHLGITESGTLLSGTIKSSVGLGILLYQGIGDTIRVSLTDDPVKEVKVAFEILKSLGLRKYGPTLVSCPTCGRCEIDIISIANKVEEHLKNYKQDIKVAVMGCSVNGPGEAKMADIGIAGGKEKAVLFKKGKIIKSISESELLQELFTQIDKLVSTDL